MTTLTPPCKLASPANQCRIDYVLNQVNHKDFEFPSVSWSFLTLDLWSDRWLHFISSVSSFWYNQTLPHLQKYYHIQYKCPWLQSFDTIYLSGCKQKVSENVLWRDAAGIQLFFSIASRNDHVRVHTSAQLFPKLMAFSVCLICRFAWSVSRSDSVISEHASIWEPVSWTSLSPETDTLPWR